MISSRWYEWTLTNNAQTAMVCILTFREHIVWESTCSRIISFQTAALRDMLYVAAFLLADACTGLWALFQDERSKERVHVM
jgi:hypothetical protein